jgi:hypothetical protein
MGIFEMTEIIKAIHIKKKFPHGWYTACGRDITARTALVSSWAEVTCKDCRSKQFSFKDCESNSGLFAGIKS